MFKKYFIAVTALSLVCCTGFAQFKRSGNIEPRVGINLATMSGLKDPSYFVGLTAGAEYETKNFSRFTFQGGFTYSQQGANASSDCENNRMGYSKYNVRMYYANIPLLLNYYITDGLAVKAGFQLGFGIGDKLNVTYAASGNSRDGLRLSDLYHYYGTFDTPLEYSIPVGVSYEYKNLVVEARYHFGLNKAISYDATTYAVNATHNYFSFTIGYKLDLNKHNYKASY